MLLGPDLPDEIPAPLLAARDRLLTEIADRIVDVPGGAFLPGSPEHEAHRLADEGPAPAVEVPGFRMLATPVTEAMFSVFDPDAGSAERPATGRPWRIAMLFSRFLGGSLPTELQWEYACRAGTTGPWSCAPEQLTEHAWFADNSGCRVQPVATRAPNPWGLYDMHGNVWEWCADRYGPLDGDHDRSAAGGRRVFRGGSASSAAPSLRSARRNHVGGEFMLDDLGFRVVWPAGGTP